MHRKDIKRILIKQLKTKYPNWKRLSKKTKKEIARAVLDEAVKGYDFTAPVKAPLEELLGISEQLPMSGMMDLKEMSQFIEDFNRSNLIKLSSYNRSPIYIKDKELILIDELMNDEIINKLLSYDGYSPCQRELFPSHLFRAELLKAIKYPEISYRKFCGKDYLGRDQKENRVFIGLPLHKNKMIDHTELSKFRTSMKFSQLVNLTVYFLYHFKQSGLLSDNYLHGIDSTELANDCRIPLASVEIEGKKIRIYNDIDSDCGKRRNKRDKSSYVVGYRLHTLTAINAENGHSFPLISLLAPANHHDSNFLKPLINLAQAMGLNLKLITADEAYPDFNGELFKETGVHLIAPPSSKVKLPNNVDSNSLSVTCDDLCEIPMQYIGCGEEGHEFKCNAAAGECSRPGECPQFRVIPIDKGSFKRIAHGSEQVQEAIDIRKNIERPFNLLKNQTGLEKVRVRSQHALLVRCAFSAIGTLLIEMAGTRRKEKVVKTQAELFQEAA